MRKVIFIICIALFVGIGNIRAQVKRGKIIPQIMLSNGTSVNISFDSQSRQLTLDISDNPSELTVLVVDAYGNLVDFDFSFFETDRLAVEADTEEVDIYVVTENGAEHVATIEATRKEDE